MVRMKEEYEAEDDDYLEPLKFDTPSRGLGNIGERNWGSGRRWPTTDEL